MVQVRSFKASIDFRSEVLILGSMPGVQSLKSNQYYAHNQNHFWKIIYALFDVPYESDYKKRILFLLSRRIGLWDVLESCYRPGSADSDIKDEKLNDFESLFKYHPKIKTVMFNGTKAYETFRKKIGFEKFHPICFKKLPSTSPAFTKKLEQKLSEWKIILDYLKQDNPSSA